MKPYFDPMERFGKALKPGRVKRAAASADELRAVEAGIAAAVTKVEEAGGKKIQGPVEIPEVGLHAYCQDPEGNIFGLIQPAADES